MDREERLAEIVAAWCAEREQGGPGDPEAWAARHPELADELRARFRAATILERHFDGGVPDRLGDYRIIREIGRGGMGIVYEAEQAAMRRRVALKVLYPSITGSPRAVKRFQQEAWAAGRLKHTNIVAIHHLGQERGIWYAAMELVEGRPLDRILDDARRSRKAPGHARRARGDEPPSTLTGSTPGTHDHYARVAELFADVADALQVVHDHGVVHRDLKPSNLLLDGEGRLKLVDFGLARLEDAASMTMTGEMLGTPYYMSPEQFRGVRGGTDGRTDIYSLGATLYETLALRPPVQGETIQTVARRILEHDAPPVSRWDKQVPADLETIVAKTLEKEPARRYASGAALARDLRRFAEGASIQARRITPLERAWRTVRRNKVRSGLLAAVLVLASLGAWLGLRAHEAEQGRARLEYARLCRLADSAAAAEAQADPLHQRSIDLYGRAIALLPDRPEAYLGRATVGWGRSLEERTRDLDAARARGLPKRTHQLARASLLSLAGRYEEARAAREAAEDLPGATPLDDFLLASMLAMEGENERAQGLLDRAVGRSRPEDLVTYRARLLSTSVRMELGDWFGAREEAIILRAFGDDSPEGNVMLAALYRRCDNEERASALFEEIVARAVRIDDGDVWLALARACGSFREHDWMKRLLDKAIEVRGEERPLLEMQLERLALAGALEERAQAAEALLARYPDSIVALNQQANAWVARVEQRSSDEMPLGPEEHSLMEKALANYTRARDAVPDYNGFRINRANALRQLRRYDEAEAEYQAALARDPYDPAATYNLGLLHFAREEYEEALRLFDRRLRLLRDDPMPLQMKAMAELRLGRTDDALATVARWPEDRPKTPQLHNTHGLVLRRLDRFEEAAEAFRRACRVGPDHAAAHANLGRECNDLGRYEEGRDALARAVELQPHNARLRVYLGNSLLGLGKTSAARDRYREATELAGDDAEAWSSLGLALALMGATDEALAAHEKAVAIRADTMTLNNQGSALLEAGRLEEAQHQLERAVELDASNPPPHYNLARVHAARGALDEAAASMRTYRSLAPEDPDGLFELALIELRRGEHETSYRLAMELAKHEPDRGRSLTMRGDAAVATRRWTAAVPLYERYLASDSPEGIRWGVWFQLGQCHYALEDWKRAAACYQESLGLQQNPYALAGFAQLHLDGPEGTWRDLPRAMELAQAAFRMAQEPATQALLARCHLRLGEPREAVAALRPIVAQDGLADAWEWLTLALALHRLGEVEEARRWFTQADATLADEARVHPVVRRLWAEARALLAK